MAPVIILSQSFDILKIVTEEVDLACFSLKTNIKKIKFGEAITQRLCMTGMIYQDKVKDHISY